MKRVLFVTVICAFVAAPARADMTVNIGGPNGAAGSVGTVTLSADTSYLYAMFDVTGNTVQGSHGEKLGINLQPTATYPWGSIQFEECNYLHGYFSDSGPIDGYLYTNWQVLGVAQTSLPGDLLAATSWATGHRITELQIPVSALGLSVGDTLLVGGAVDFDSAFHKYPVGLDFSDISTYAEVTVVPVPAAVILGILGLGAAGVKLRKFA